VLNYKNPELLFLNLANFQVQGLDIYQKYWTSTTINSISEIFTKIIIFDLPMDGIADDRKIKLFEKFENIEYVPLPDKDKRTTVEIVPNHIKNRPLRARDTEHPGAQWQYNLYDWIWQYIQQKGIDKKLIE
jgi:hypothetical protein